MKTRFFLYLALIGPLARNAYSQVIDPAPYCEARTTELTAIFDNHIKSVNIGILTNNTGTTNLNGSEYAYYNNIAAIELPKSVDIPVTITVSKNDVELNACWIFVDYNRNNAFEETERVGNAPTSQIADADFGDINLGFNIHIPASAQPGQTRMRIIYTSDFMLTGPVPCNSNTEMAPPAFYYGEIEDYDIKIGTGQANADIVESPQNTIRLSVSPNPGNGCFRLESKTDITLAIYNGTGKKIGHRHLSAGIQTLDISDLPAGIYYLVAEYNYIKQTLKLIKE